MARHFLALHVPAVMTECLFHIEDHSVYDPNVPYVCPVLQVLVPGYEDAIIFDPTTTPAVVQNFQFSLTACNLEVQLSNCGTDFDSLPDGIYAARLSLSPYTNQYVEVNHLRVTCLMHQWRRNMCALKLGACEPRPEIEEKFRKLMDIKGYIEAAVASVEECQESTEGMKLYDYAKKLLDTMNCKTC